MLLSSNIGNNSQSPIRTNNKAYVPPVRVKAWGTCTKTN